MPSTFCCASSHAFRIIASLALSLSAFLSPFFSPFPRGQRISLGLFRLYPFTTTFFIFLPYPDPLPSYSLLPHTSPDDPAYSPPFFSHRSHPRQRFSSFSFSRPRESTPSRALPYPSPSPSPPPTLLSHARSRPHPHPAPRVLALLLLPIEFCSSSFMHPIRPIVRSLAHPPRHRHHRRRRHPFLLASNPVLLPPSLPLILLPSSHPSLSDSSCVINVRRCTGPPDIFHAFVT